jgi:hypothetical protein
MDLREVFGNDLGRPPEFLRLLELNLFFGGSALQTALAVTDAEMVLPGLPDFDVAVGKVGVDADLVDDGVIAQT